MVGHPCNTNAMICRQYAPSIPATSFTSLTRLYQLRTQFQVAVRLSAAVASSTAPPPPAPTAEAPATDLWSVRPTDLHNVIVWANHSATLAPDLVVAEWDDGTGRRPLPRAAAIVDDELVTVLRNRGTAVLDARKVSSGISGAAAVARHMRDWWNGTPPVRADPRVAARVLATAPLMDVVCVLVFAVWRGGGGARGACVHGGWSDRATS